MGPLTVFSGLDSAGEAVAGVEADTVAGGFSGTDGTVPAGVSAGEAVLIVGRVGAEADVVTGATGFKTGLTNSGRGCGVGGGTGFGGGGDMMAEKLRMPLATASANFWR